MGKSPTVTSKLPRPMLMQKGSLAAAATLTIAPLSIAARVPPTTSDVCCLLLDWAWSLHGLQTPAEVRLYIFGCPFMHPAAYCCLLVPSWCL